MCLWEKGKITVTFSFEDIDLEMVQAYKYSAGHLVLSSLVREFIKVCTQF